jgi:hypothetical protein
MLGLCIGIGWFGFGRRDDLFTHWLDCGLFSFGYTPLIAKERVREVSRRAREIKDAFFALKRRLGK